MDKIDTAEVRRPPMAGGFPMAPVGTLEITRAPDADLHALMCAAFDTASRIFRCWRIVQHLPPDALDGQAEHLRAELLACMDDVQRLPNHVVQWNVTPDPLQAAREAVARQLPASAETVQAAREVVAAQHPAPEPAPYVRLRDRKRMQERIVRRLKK